MGPLQFFSLGLYRIQKCPLVQGQQTMFMVLLVLHIHACQCKSLLLVFVF